MRQNRDPFDRMLAAQAQIEGIPVVTADPVFSLLRNAGDLVIAALSSCVAAALVQPFPRLLRPPQYDPAEAASGLHTRMISYGAQRWPGRRAASRA